MVNNQLVIHNVLVRWVSTVDVDTSTALVSIQLKYFSKDNYNSNLAKICTNPSVIKTSPKSQNYINPFLLQIFERNTFIAPRPCAGKDIKFYWHLFKYFGTYFDLDIFEDKGTGLLSENADTRPTIIRHYGPHQKSKLMFILGYCRVVILSEKVWDLGLGSQRDF